MSKGPWWNTSAGLLGKYEELPGFAGWEKFAASYDQPECQELRLKRWREARPKQQPRSTESPLPSILADMAKTVLGQWELVMSMPWISEDGATSHPGIGPSHDEAAKNLAKLVLGMTAPNDNGQLLYQLADEIREQNKPKPGPIVELNRTFEVTRAMLIFIHRERRIPGKTELHIEANRRHESARMSQERESHKIGDVVSKDRARFRIYMFDRIPGFAYLCPFGQWDNLRWNETHYSKVILKEAGLRGLPHPKLGGHQKKVLRPPT